MRTIDQLDIALVGRRLYITKASYNSETGWHIEVAKHFSSLKWHSNKEKMREAMLDVIHQYDAYFSM